MTDIQPSAQPPIVPPTPPTPDPNESARHWQSVADQRAAEIASLKAQLQAPPTPPPQTPPTPPTNTGLDFSNIAAWRAEDGSMKSEYRDGVFGKGVPKETQDQLWQTVTQAQQIVQMQAQQQVVQHFGSTEAYDAASKWAAENIPQELPHLNAALANPVLAPRALAELKERAEKGGAFAQPKQGVNEPPPVPNGNMSHQTDTPLRPGSPECNAYIADPKWTTDQAYRESGTRRMQAGMVQLPRMPLG